MRLLRVPLPKRAGQPRVGVLRGRPAAHAHRRHPPRSVQIGIQTKVAPGLQWAKQANSSNQNRYAKMLRKLVAWKFWRFPTLQVSELLYPDQSWTERGDWRNWSRQSATSNSPQESTTNRWALNWNHSLRQWTNYLIDFRISEANGEASSNTFSGRRSACSRWPTTSWARTPSWSRGK